MDFIITGGNKNASITLEEKWDGDILYVTVKMALVYCATNRLLRL